MIRSKRMLTDDKSNILVFMTGHGGDEFLKFQDSEELGAQDLADAFAQMFEKKRYNEIMFLIDTCQAASMYKRISSPNIISAASALTGQSSYSHHSDSEIGVSVIDRWTYYNLQTLEKVKRGDNYTLQNLFDTYDERKIASTPGIRKDLFKRPTQETLITDFFGGVQSIHLTPSGHEMKPAISMNQFHAKQVGLPAPLRIGVQPSQLKFAHLVVGKGTARETQIIMHVSILILIVFIFNKIFH